MGSQAAKERDESEVLRLMNIAVYWERLADLEDWQRDSLTGYRRKGSPEGFLESWKG